MPAAQQAGRLVIDLSRLASMDWWAALILLWAGRLIGRRNGELVLAAAQPDVARLLDVLGAAAAVTVCASVERAASCPEACAAAAAAGG